MMMENEPKGPDHFRWCKCKFKTALPETIIAANKVKKLIECKRCRREIHPSCVDPAPNLADS